MEVFMENMPSNIYHQNGYFMMSSRWKNSFLFIISFIAILVVILICPSYQHAFSQTPGAGVPSQTQLESIKILNLMPSQKVDLNKELAISGESSDSAAKDCSVYIIVNGVLPYQNAIASGPGGAKDYSQWKFVVHEQYTHLKDGNNKITAKLLCASAPARWYSVVVNGVSSSNASEAIPVQSNQPQSNASEAIPVQSNQPQSNASEAIPVQSNQPQSNASEAIPVQSNQPQSNASEAIPVQSNQPQSNASEANNTTNQLLISITSLKDPVARGDTQNSTIAVTDSDHKPIANAQINGKLVYPGNNFEKDFNGLTDLEGKFVYTWIIGKKGDVGPLVMRVNASSEGHPAGSAENTFEIVKKSESSQIKNQCQSHFQKP